MLQLQSARSSLRGVGAYSVVAIVNQLHMGHYAQLHGFHYFPRHAMPVEPAMANAITVRKSQSDALHSNQQVKMAKSPYQSVRAFVNGNTKINAKIYGNYQSKGSWMAASSGMAHSVNGINGLSANWTKKGEIVVGKSGFATESNENKKEASNSTVGEKIVNLAVKSKEFFIKFWRGLVELYHNTKKANAIRKRIK